MALAPDARRWNEENAADADAKEMPASEEGNLCEDLFVPKGQRDGVGSQ